LKKYFDAFITGILLMNAMAQQRAHIFLCKYITWLYYFHSVVLRIPIVQRLYIYNSSKLPVIWNHNIFQSITLIDNFQVAIFINKKWSIHFLFTVFPINWRLNPFPVRLFLCAHVSAFMCVSIWPVFILVYEDMAHYMIILWCIYCINVVFMSHCGIGCIILVCCV
jgi:hypothetical protein